VNDKNLIPFRYLRWKICCGKETEYICKFKKEGERFYNEDLAVLCAACGMTNNGTTVENARKALMLFNPVTDVEELLNDVLVIYHSRCMKRRKDEHEDIQKPAGNHTRKGQDDKNQNHEGDGTKFV
jgi:hypothetical protein